MSDTSILVVHQDKVVLAELAELVVSAGYACLTAAGAAEALELAAGGGVDIIVPDMDLPEMSGLEFISRARRNLPETAFILMTGYENGGDWENIFRAGAKDFITKPFTGPEFRTKLQRTLLQHRLEVENLRLLRQQAEVNERLAFMLAISTDLTAELSVDRLFPLIIGRVTEALSAERSSLYVIDRENREIWTKVAEQIGEIRLPLGQGISGRVAETGETINVNDAWELPYFNKDFDLRHSFRTRSVLCLPVKNQAGGRIGAIQVINKRGGGAFTADDEAFLKGLASQVGIALENSLLHEELRLSFESSIRTLSAVVDARHPLTAGHSQRVTEYSLLIAREMGLDDRDLEVLKYAALLHDIGKIGIRDLVLLKSGPFTAEERREMNLHPEKTRVILENFRFPRALREVPFVAACHHEKVDGKGYPGGLTGDKLPLGSKIMAVADVFDALTSRRDYPKYADGQWLGVEPMALKRVVRLLENDSGSHFDAEVVEVFLRCLPRILLMFRGSYFPSESVDPFLREYALPFLTGTAMEIEL